MRKAEARCRLKWARHGTSPPFWTFGPVQTGPGMSMWSSGSHVTLSAGGRWIRASGSAPAATPLTDRGVKPQATAAGCHFGEILPQGATLMMALSVSFSRY
jgi:hypothetical protein